MPEVLHTERLALEPWVDGHLGLLRRLATTPAVVRYVGDGLIWTDARIQAVAERNARHWRDHGFGWRVARLTGTGGGPARAIGLIALNYAGEGAGIDPDEHEIGWWLEPGAWGRGLAREGAAAVREEAFGRVGAPSIVARIQPANAASLRVAAAIGLRPDSETTGRAGEAVSVLRLTAGDWRALRQR